MARVWLISFFVVAIVVASILFFTGDWSDSKEKKEPDKGAIVPASQGLRAGDVLTYLRVFPQVDSILFEAMKAGDTGGVDTRARIRTVLQNHKLTEQEWDALRKRVWDVVHELRAEANLPARRAEIDRRIAQKELAKSRAGADDEALKKQLDQDLAALFKYRDSPGINLHASDREQAGKHWEQLNPMVPQVGAPKAGARRRR